MQKRAQGGRGEIVVVQKVDSPLPRSRHSSHSRRKTKGRRGAQVCSEPRCCPCWFDEAGEIYVSMASTAVSATSALLTRSTSPSLNALMSFTRQLGRRYCRSRSMYRLPPQEQSWLSQLHSTLDRVRYSEIFSDIDTRMCHDCSIWSAKLMIASPAFYSVLAEHTVAAILSKQIERLRRC